MTGECASSSLLPITIAFETYHKLKFDTRVNPKSVHVIALNWARSAVAAVFFFALHRFLETPARQRAGRSSLRAEECNSLQDLAGQNRISDILRRPSEVLNDEYICFPTHPPYIIYWSFCHLVVDG